VDLSPRPKMNGKGTVLQTRGMPATEVSPYPCASKRIGIIEIEI